MRLLLATSNRGKVQELQQLLARTGLEVTGLDDLPQRPNEVAETGATFADNACLKAIGYSRATGLVALADDSGLVVNALDGQPGVFSARYAGPDGDDDANVDKLLEELGDRPPEERKAHFACAAALFIPLGSLPDIAREGNRPNIDYQHRQDGTVLVSEGRTHGTILTVRRGDGGFGYDPVFLSDDLGVSFAEADRAAKNRVSHRGRALKPLIDLLVSL